MKKILFWAILFTLISCGNTKSVRFAVCTDVHQDLIYDATDRIKTFIKAAEDEKSDFIIQLGDFCLPFEKNEPFLKAWNSFEGPKYHVLGNHDMDASPKIVIQDFLGMEKSFYSFDMGKFHFVVLDANFYKEGEQLVPYSCANYFEHIEDRAYIPENQIQWLKDDLSKTDNLTVVFSHQSLEHWGGIKNREAVRKLFDDANKPKKKVVACFCGHDHEDRYAEINGIHYIGLNSASYAWVGSKFEYSGRFPKSIEDKYKNLKYTLPYRESVFAIVKINAKGTISIKGIQSDFIKPGPDELGASDYHYSAKISNRKLTF